MLLLFIRGYIVCSLFDDHHSVLIEDFLSTKFALTHITTEESLPGFKLDRSLEKEKRLSSLFKQPQQQLYLVYSEDSNGSVISISSFIGENNFLMGIVTEATNIQNRNNDNYFDYKILR